MKALTIKKGENGKRVRELLRTWTAKRKIHGIDLSKYLGTIQLKRDPLEIQKDLRNEWE